jgi:hypothetical protein
MANEIYHRTNWGEAKPEGFGDMYFDSSATNKLYNRSTYYENSDATDKILGDIPNKASIVFTATGYSQDKIGSAIPVDANGDFDFHRESTATRVNEAGLIEASQSNDTPRIDFTTGEGAFLIEPQKTNELRYSNDFSEWDENNNASVTLNVLTSPDGTQNAAQFTYDGTSNGRIEEAITVNNGSDYTFSIYLKNKDISDPTQVFIGFSSAPNEGEYVTITNEWKRFSTTQTANGSTEFPRVSCDLAGSLYAFGAQVEESSFATSYIPTNGSTATRIAERVNSSGNSDLFNDSEGVLYAEIASLAESVGNNKKFSISSGASSNSVFFFHLGVQTTKYKFL